MWMAVQNKLTTQDKIAVWKPNEILECALSNQCPDSHNHLFFNCPYSSNVGIVWASVALFFPYHGFSHWVLLDRVLRRQTCPNCYFWHSVVGWFGMIA
ncbi:RNA-directed DNA polymerase, eukaryota, reverse transcriptase zinc-binding domain protein, partial [Tanacetum coccineum]